MKLFVTGSTGFLGRYVVAEALRRGHTVRAVVRNAESAERLGWTASDKLEFANVDLRSRTGLVEALEGIDCVLHLAAKKAGDIYSQLHGTVVTTENLIRAMGEANVAHVVHVSTFSVFDYSRMKPWTVVDENSPLESTPELRDEYAQAKLIQERLIVEEATKRRWRWTVLRPGMIYGPDNVWSARLGVGGKGKFWVRMGGSAPLPLNYVENAADAIVLAAETPADRSSTSWTTKRRRKSGT
jgi:nucleoside-diphosphate-sugar epimerase